MIFVDIKGFPFNKYVPREEISAIFVLFTEALQVDAAGQISEMPDIEALETLVDEIGDEIVKR